MPVTSQPVFASLAEQLNRGATRAALGMLSFRSDPLREHLRGIFQSAPGTGSSFLADPVFEATFGWRLAERTLGDLSGTLLHPDVVKALHAPPAAFAEEYAWPVQRYPYQLQIEAWQASSRPSPRARYW
jgi:DEAD/DEAH box helicase domain-containing protein